MRDIAEVLTISPSTVANIKKKHNVQPPENKARRSIWIWMPAKDASKVQQEQRKWRTVIEKHAKEVAATRSTAKVAKEVEAVEKTAANSKVTTTSKRKRESQESGSATADAKSRGEDKLTELTGSRSKGGSPKGRQTKPTTWHKCHPILSPHVNVALKDIHFYHLPLQTQSLYGNASDERSLLEHSARVNRLEFLCQYPSNFCP